MNLSGINPIIILGALLAFAFSIADLWHFHALAHDTDLFLIVSSLAALGVHYVNGSAVSINSAVQDLKQQVASTVDAPAVVKPPTTL